MNIPLRAAGLILAGLVAVLVPTISAQAAESGYPMPAPSMAGVNDWSCKPTAAHPRPLVLVHGTASSKEDWDDFAPLLIERGYCVFALDYGAHWLTVGQVNGFGPVKDSADQVSAFIDKVRSSTGASEIDYVGHSQGGMIGEYWAKYLGGATKVERMVLLSPVTHGTTMVGLTEYSDATIVGRPVADLAMSVFCPACVDMEKGSAFVKKLNTGPITQPGVTYTVISTQNDTTVTPPESQFINEPGVTNMFVQNICPGVVIKHEDMPRTALTAQLVLNALNPPEAQPIVC